jgi:aquaporin Z
MTQSFADNWKVYLMEALCLGIFMTSASAMTTILEYPGSYVNRLIPDGFIRLCLMGVSMGLTAIAIFYSPFGKLSGAHMNPAVSLVFVRLGKLKTTDAIFYMVFQCAGGIFAVSLMSLIIGEAFFHPNVNFVVTKPGIKGAVVAFTYEAVMSFIMMLMVLFFSNKQKTAKYTGLIAGAMVTIFIILSAPVSGFSINPARSLASAVPALQFPSFWIYMTAPFLGMIAAGELFIRRLGKPICAKIVHSSSYDCIFDCGYCKHNH